MDEIASLKGKSKVFAEEEYAAQLHDVSTQTVHQNVITIVEDTIDEALDGLWSFIQKICPECELQTAHSLVKKAYHEAVGKHSPEILVPIQETLFIPPNILLPGNEAQKQQYSLPEVEDLVKRNIELKSQICKNSKLKSALALEVQVLENVETLELKLNDWENLFKIFRSETEETKKRVKFIKDLCSNVDRVNSGAKKKNPYSIKSTLLTRFEEL